MKISNYALATAALVAAQDGWTTTCSGDIQKNLRYNTGGRPADVPGPTGPTETLADAVCCDGNFKVFAEPQFFFLQPDVDLFSQLDKTKPIIFYDSVCGIPLFKAPTGRSFDDWVAETMEHGWPSFREAEMYAENIITNRTTGEVLSACGTHLGSNLPDEEGDRYCMDLVCISGNPISSKSQQVDMKAEYQNLITFDGSAETNYKFQLTNDPVMGGLSRSTFQVDAQRKVAVFNGTVEIVPSLAAPGFCQVLTESKLYTERFPDVSKFSHLMITVRNTVPSYLNWKVSFSAGLSIGFNAFKADFVLDPTTQEQTVSIPWDAFSNDWSSYTGECDTLDPTGVQHYCCDKDHPEVCVEGSDLTKISQFGIWAEGYQGDFHLEIVSIGAGNL